LHPSCAQVSKHTSYWCYHCRSKSMCARIGLHPSCASKRAHLCVCARTHTHAHTRNNIHTPAHGLTPLRPAPVCTVHPLSQRMGQTLPLPSLIRCGGCQTRGAYQPRKRSWGIPA
jgi:hypothetical protein